MDIIGSITRKEGVIPLETEKESGFALTDSEIINWIKKMQIYFSHQTMDSVKKGMNDE